MHFMSNLKNTAVNELLEKPILADEKDSISTIINTLIENNAYDVFVGLPGKIVGYNVRDIIGVRDIASSKLSAIGKMIPTLSPTSKISEAARILSLYRRRALPIVDKQNIIGQISARKIVQKIDEYMKNEKSMEFPASELMSGNPIVISSKDTVSSARTIMRRRRIDHLPVINNEKLSGIITSTDVMKTMLPSERIGRKTIGVDGGKSRFDMSVSGITNKDVITADITDKIKTVTDLMTNMNSTYCIMKVSDEVQGIITYSDVISLLQEEEKFETIPIFLMGLPDDPFEAELAKSKFKNIVQYMKKVYPDIEQAKCRIKMRETPSPRKRYEVTINIMSTHSSYHYSDIGWDLKNIFDQISNAMKKKVGQRSKRTQRNTMRRVEIPQE